LTSQFDGVEVESLRVGAQELADAVASTPEPVLDALRRAAAGIADYHRMQLRPPHDWTNPENGVRIESRWVPVGRAGCYVPGGRAAYPSTVLMTAIPAKVAGVEQVALCVPPAAAHNGIAPITLAAAAVAESIQPVDVICGPGNRFVALAKQEVAGRVGVAAAFAGPSEVVVVADDTVDPSWAAIDVMVQAEHGPDGLAWLICWSEEHRTAILDRLDALLADAPRAADIRATLASSGVAVVVDDPQTAIAVSDFIAPEHLELLCEGAAGLAATVRNAGAIFCGPLSPASIGDYAAGPSHVLPTHGSARFASALTVDDFLRHHHIVTLDRPAFDGLADTVETLADAEGLIAHADSIRLRRLRPDEPAGEARS
jgi:histidinol dehydrogenase